MNQRCCVLVFVSGWIAVWMAGGCDQGRLKTEVATSVSEAPSSPDTQGVDTGPGIPAACSCVGKQCGSDGCTGACGTCAAELTCSADGLCTCPGGGCGCVPACAAKQCGSDGCGGVCGTCPDGTACSADGQCACEPVEQETVGGYLRIAVTWPKTLGVVAGSGVVHLWSRDVITYSGGAFTAHSNICGSDIPEITFSSIAGGGKMKFDFPDATFELGNPPLPLVAHGGTSAGFQIGAAFVATQSASLFGCSMADPNAAWPDSASGLTQQDDDEDQNPGATANNRSGNGYVYPKVSMLGAGQADKMYLASRVVVTQNGTRQTCTTVGGAATVESFDSHVVGCHLSGGADCNATQAGFCDTNRAVMAPLSATWKSVRVSASATCAEIRAALPKVP